MKDEDKARLDGAMAALESALKGGNDGLIRSASDELDAVLRSVGTYTSGPEGENDDGAYDV